MSRSLLIVGNFLYSSTGTAGVCEELAAGLSGAGWTVSTTSDKANRILRIFDMMRTTLVKRRYYRVALVDVYSGPSFIWAEAVTGLLQSLNKPIVLTLHGGNLPEFSQQYPTRVRRLFQRAAAITTPSTYLQQELSSFGDDFCLIPNGIDLDRYPFTLRETAMPRMIWLRAYHTIYNPVLAVRVVERLKSDIPQIHLTMIGPDKGDGSLARLEQSISGSDLTDNIAIRERVNKEDIPMHLDNADIFLNTTNIDNTPISVIEAMASGLCVVSTNVGGMSYLINDGENGLLVPPNDSAAMADAIRRILQEPGLPKRLSSNARRTVEHFDWRIILPQWDRLLTRFKNHPG